jgi:hypothetical protein
MYRSCHPSFANVIVNGTCLAADQSFLNLPQNGHDPQAGIMPKG